MSPHHKRATYRIRSPPIFQTEHLAGRDRNHKGSGPPLSCRGPLLELAGFMGDGFAVLLAKDDSDFVALASLKEQRGLRLRPVGRLGVNLDFPPLVKRLIAVHCFYSTCE